MGRRHVPGRGAQGSEFDTERLHLRPITLEDRDDVRRNFSDVEVTRWFMEEPFATVEEVDRIVEEWVEHRGEGTAFVWAVVPHGSNRVVGTCGYETYVVGGEGEIGFDLTKESWGRGLMHEALVPILTFGFGVLGIREVVAHCYLENSRAIRLLEGLGFRSTAVRERSHHFVMSEGDWISGQEG
jgi:ribosomal-protein-alanine N-acetyltransferase